MSKGKFSHAAPILAVSDVREVAEYYRAQLGFSVEFLWEDPPSYGVLRRGGVSIHLTQYEDPRRITALYVFVEDADAIYREYLEKGVNLLNEIGNRDYRMRDFDLKDPWGNLITIGQGLE